MDGRAREFRVRYVIGADGANSFVRRTLGIERSDFGYNERWLNLDSENKRDLGAACALTTIYCDPARAYMHMPIGTRRTVSSCVCCPARKRPIGNRRTPAGAGCMNAMAWGRTT